MSNIDIPTVKDLGQLPIGLPSFELPFGSIADGKVPFNLETFGIVLPTALAISLVGLMETFLTQDIIDDITEQLNADPRLSTSEIVVEEYEHGIAVQASLTYVPYNITEKLVFKFDQDSSLRLT